MNIRLLSVGLGVMLASGAYGCGGDDGTGGSATPRCAAFEACGGNVVGTWQSTSFCTSQPLEQVMDSTMGEPACSGTYRSVTATLNETITLNADGTYQDTAAVIMNGRLVLEIPCINALSDSSVTAAQLPSLCSSFQDSLTSQAMFTSATCSVVSNTCACDFGARVDNQASGTYAVTGSTLTTDQGGSTTFCVQGSELTTRSTNGTLGDAFTYYQRTA